MRWGNSQGISDKMMRRVKGLTPAANNVDSCGTVLELVSDLEWNTHHVGISLLSLHHRSVALLQVLVVPSCDVSLHSQ